METAAVFDELVGGMSGFEYLASGRIGVSIARNQGARSVRSGLVLFTDDDCEVTDDWVDHWRRFFEAHPTVGIAFGKVAVPEFDPTAGHIPNFDPGHQDRIWGPEVFSRGAGFVGMGANMAVRHDAFDVVGGFDEILGPGARFRSPATTTTWPYEWSGRISARPRGTADRDALRVPQQPRGVSTRAAVWHWHRSHVPQACPLP